jgi:choline monooxygenase
MLSPRPEGRHVAGVILAEGDQISVEAVAAPDRIFGSVLKTLVEDLDQTLSSGLTLSPQWYFDPQVFIAEQQGVFRHSWIYVGHAAKVTQPGDYFTTDIGGVPVVVLRDKDGELRAFVNVCRHRGCTVARGEGNAKSLQCVYHAWTYNLSGELVGVPRSKNQGEFGEAGFNPAEWPLIGAQLGTWGPLVFVNLDLDAPDFEATAGEMMAEAVERGSDPSEFSEYDGRSSYPTAANWKLLVDNMVECYHCPTIHPEFRSLYALDPGEFIFKSGPNWAYAQTYPKADLHGGDVALVEALGTMHYYYLYPNFLAILGANYLFLMRFTPTGPETCALDIDTCFVQGRDESTRGENFDFHEMLWRQDVEVVQQAHLGQASGHVRGGPLLGDSEARLRAIQANLRESLAQELRRSATAESAA